MNEIKDKYKLLNKYINNIINNKLSKKDIKYIIIKDIIKNFNIFFYKYKFRNIPDIENKYLDLFSNIL